MADKKRNTVQWRCSPMVWFWENFHENIQAKRMVITKDYLNSLDGDRYILFKVNSSVLDHCRKTDRSFWMFESVLRSMKVACTGAPRGQGDVSALEIPRTVVNGSVYVIHVLGPFDDFEFNNRLMVEQGTNYLLAIERQPNEWHQVQESTQPIEGAEILPYRGSYTELGTTKLRDDKIKLGFLHLMMSLMEVFKGSKEVRCFLSVCVNLMEPARYPVIARYMFQQEGRFNPYAMKKLTPLFLYLIGNWERIGDAVIKYQDTGVWLIDFGLLIDDKDQEKFPIEEGELIISTEELEAFVNPDSIHKHLAMVKN